MFKCMYFDVKVNVMRIKSFSLVGWTKDVGRKIVMGKFHADVKFEGYVKII